jgi:hypothetical protein
MYVRSTTRGIDVGRKGAVLVGNSLSAEHKSALGTGRDHMRDRLDQPPMIFVRVEASYREHERCVDGDPKFASHAFASVWEGTELIQIDPIRDVDHLSGGVSYRDMRAARRLGAAYNPLWHYPR